jgi:hypothetical protein
MKFEFAFDKKNGTKIIIEAGHIYTNTAPGQEQETGVKIGSLFANLFTLFGYDVEKWLFIDDYNPKFQDGLASLDEKAYLTFISTHGFAPDKTVYEASLAPEAKGMLEFLVKHNYAGLQHHTGKVVLHKGNIILHDPKQDKYMCALLDACLYLDKAKAGNFSVTVLDKQFEQQQNATMAILKKLDFNVETVFPIYYTTPQIEQHESVVAANIYAGPVPASHVNGAINIVKSLALLANHTPVESSIDLKVMQHVIEA